MSRRHLLLLATVAFASACSTGATPKETAAEIVPEEDAAKEPAVEVDLELYVGELFIKPLEPMSPLGSDVQEGMVAVSTGRELGLLGLVPGVHTVTLPTNDPAQPKLELTARVREDSTGRATGRVDGDREMGVGELALFSPRSFQSVFVVGREHMEWEPIEKEDGRRKAIIELRARTPGITQIIGVRNDGRIWRFVYDVLPEGRLPPNARVHDLTVGGPGHDFDVKGITRIDVFDPDVVGVSAPKGWTAQIDARAPGVTAVALFRGNNSEPTIMWYRVAAAK